MLVYLIEPTGYFLNEISYLNKYEKLFEINNYNKGFIDSESEFYKDKNANFQGSNFCISLISKNSNLITEANITTLVDILPYNKKIHAYLLKVIGALP
jgi:hypothetical protein